MKKTERPKNRYVLFEVVGTIANHKSNAIGRPSLAEGGLLTANCKTNAVCYIENFENWIYKEVLKFFGEYGFSKIGFKLIEYNSKNNKGIIRCNRQYVEKIVGFLALLDEPRVKSLKTSGTIRKLREMSKCSSAITS